MRNQNHHINKHDYNESHDRRYRRHSRMMHQQPYPYYNNERHHHNSDFAHQHRPYSTFDLRTPYDEDTAAAVNAMDNEGPRQHESQDLRRYGNTYENHAGKGPRGYVRSDERIKEDVSDALFHDPDVDATNVEVKVKDAEVTLTGSVVSRLMKRKAEDCIENISGVREISNQIRVRSSTEPQTTRIEPTTDKGGSYQKTPIKTVIN